MGKEIISRIKISLDFEHLNEYTTTLIAKRSKSILLLEKYDLLHDKVSSHGESNTIKEPKNIVIM